MRIYDRDSRVPDDQLRMMLDKDVLEGRGFKLEITSKLLREPGSRSDKPSFLTTYFYFKTVDCSQVPEVNEEVDSLIPGMNREQSTPGDLRTNYKYFIIVFSIVLVI